MRGLKRGLMAAGRRSGGWRLVAATHGPLRLTVLAYHRIADHAAPDFVGFAGNASATPAEFDAQLGWARERFTPVSLEEVAAGVAGGRLPRRPLLVTFDDGYRDNRTAALPILERHGFPGSIFLATDHIGTAVPFWWDQVAWCLGTTAMMRPHLPLMGEVDLSGDRQRVIRHFIARLKALPNAEMRSVVAALPTILEVGSSTEAFRGTMLDWDDVAAMARAGVSFGAHTCSHPILARMPAASAAAEISSSVRRVAEAIGQTPLGFAYPNGCRGDIEDANVAAVAEAGVRLGFTLLPGPARWGDVVRDPLRIRRIYIHHGDGLDRFAAKVGGVARIVKALA